MTFSNSLIIFLPSVIFSLIFWVVQKITPEATRWHLFPKLISYYRQVYIFFLLQFYFATQRQQSYGPEYLLVTEYHSKGSLLQYLKCNTVTWQEMCSLGHSLSSGLAYLHNDGKSRALILSLGQNFFLHNQADMWWK